MRVAWGDNHRGDCDGDLEQVKVVARQIPNRSRPMTGHQSGGRNYIGTTEKTSILYSRQELAERLRLAWKHRENRANIDIFLAHGFAVEERCDSELSMCASMTPLPNEEFDSIAQDQDPDKEKIQWNSEAIATPEKLNDVLGELRNGNMDFDRETETRKIDGKEEIASPRVMENDSKVDSVVNKDEEDIMESAEKEREERVNSDIHEIKKTRISIDCTNLQPPYSTTTCQSFIASKENVIAATEVACDDFSLARQKRASFHSGTNRAFLIPMPEKSAKRSAEASKYSATDKIISTKSIETKCFSADKNKDERQRQTRIETKSPVIDKNGGLAKASSVVPLERTRRTNSAPPQRQVGSVASAATRVQVNIVIDAPSLAEAASDKPIVCGSQDGKNVERSKESLTKVGCDFYVLPSIR